MKKGSKKTPFNEMVEKNLQKRLDAIKKKEEREKQKKQKELDKLKKSLEAKAKKPVKKGGRKKANPLTPEEIAQRKADREKRKQNRVEHLIEKRNRKKKNTPHHKNLLRERKKRQKKNPDIFKTTLEFGRMFINAETCIEFIKKHILKTDNPVCKYCNEETKVYQLANRPVFKCSECKRQFRLTQGTIFHNSKVSIDKWFHLLIHEIVSTKKLTVGEVVEHIGVSKPTCHKMLNKIRETAFRADKRTFQQNCTVAIDTTAFFGKNVNRHDDKKFTKKETFALSTQTLVIKENDGLSRGIVIDDLKEETILKAIRENVPMGATIYTDEHKSFGKLNAMGFKHETVNHSKGEHGRGIVSNNGAESFNSILKIASMCHRNRISKKYLQQFINSVSFHANLNAARYTLCERFFIAIENIIYCRKPKKQIAGLRMIYKQSEFITEIAQMYETQKKQLA